jgi:hypothetical protein
MLSIPGVSRAISSTLYTTMRAQRGELPEGFAVDSR